MLCMHSSGPLSPTSRKTSYAASVQYAWLAAPRRSMCRLAARDSSASAAVAARSRSPRTWSVSATASARRSSCAIWASDAWHCRWWVVVGTSRYVNVHLYAALNLKPSPPGANRY
eukprot:362044-Chlamydomonas_euryale.AAC.10